LPSASILPADMIRVHHLNNSRSQRILWLLEELDLDYTVVRYQRDAQTMLAPPELRAVHPLGKSPVVTDDANTLAESGAIIEYLVERYGNGRLIPPVQTPERLRYTYWLHYAEGSAMTPLLLSLIFRRMPKAPMPFFARPIVRGIADKVKASFVDPQLKTHFDFMESELAQRPWFAGDEFSAADIQMSFPIEAGRARGMIDASRPKLAAFLERIHARPAYQSALEQGGAFAILG
jgi:glutathione S-transferase